MAQLQFHVNLILSIWFFFLVFLCWSDVNWPEHPLRKHARVIYRFFFSVVKIENFQKKTFDIFLIFAQFTDCGYTLESPR